MEYIELKQRSKSNNILNIDLSNDKSKYINDVFKNLCKLYFQHYYINIVDNKSNYEVLKKSNSDTILYTNNYQNQSITLYIYINIDIDTNLSNCSNEKYIEIPLKEFSFKCLYTLKRYIIKCNNDVYISNNPLHNETSITIEINKSSYLFEYIIKYKNILFNKQLQNINSLNIHKIICKFMYEYV